MFKALCKFIFVSSHELKIRMNIDLFKGKLGTGGRNWVSRE